MTLSLAPLYAYTTRRTDRGDHTHRLWTGTHWLPLPTPTTLFKDDTRT